MKKVINILITGVGSTTSQSVIKGFKKQDIFDVNIIGIDINNKKEIAGSTFCNKFYKVPLAVEEDEYLSAIIDIIKKESIELVIPINDIELEIISKNRYRLEKDAFLLVSPYNTVITCNDKFKTYEFLKSIDLPCPKTITINKNLNLNEQISKAKLKYPLIAKPRRGVSSRDVYHIYDKEDLILIKRIKDPIIQEKITGKEYTIDIFCDNNKIICAIPRLRIETRAGISYKGITVKEQGLIDYAKKISEVLNIIGPANIQCFKEKDLIKIIEINPRFSGGLPLTIAAGINTPLFALMLAKGENLTPIKNFKICRMCRYWEEVYYCED